MNKSIKVLALATALALPVSVFASAAPQEGMKGEMMEKGEKHPEIRAAMQHLREAKEILQKKAAHDFKGHRVQAIQSIDQALEHLRQALESDEK